MATVAAFEFLEIADAVRPVDDTGNLDDLATPVGLVTPPIVQGRWGRARQFGDLRGFTAADAVVDATLLSRDASFFGWIDFKIGNFVDTQVGVVHQRHGGGSAIAFQVELERVSSALVKLRATWDGPTSASTVGVTFAKPAAEFMIGVVRIRNSETDVEVRYFVNGDLLATETVTEGVIAPTTGGLFAVGYDAVAASDYLPDSSVLEFFQIDDDPIPDEEVRQMYRQIAVHQPSGYKVLRAFLPSGEAWSRDPTSFVQRWIASEGDALGLEIADIERFREDFLPDRAYGGALQDWERITGQVPSPSDTIAVRRARVLGFLRVVLGFPPEDIKTALEPLFGLDAVDIEIIEFDAVKEDDFSVEDLIAGPSRMWITRLGSGTIVVDVGTPECDVSFGPVTALYWKESPVGTGGPVREACISAKPGLDTDGSMIIIELATGATATDVFAGVFMRDPSGEDALFWGLTGADEDLSHFRYSSGAMSAITVAVAAAGVPQVLAMRYNGAGLYDLGRIAGGVFVVDVVDAPGPTSPRWVGFGAIERVETGSSFSGSFRDAKVFEPNSSRAFTYLAIRNPALPGTFDIESAQAQLDRQSPAHTIPIAATTDQGFALGPTGLGLLGSSPLFPVV